MALRCRSFSKIKSKNKRMCSPDESDYYFLKSKIPIMNLIVGSRNLIKVSKNMSF